MSGFHPAYSSAMDRLSAIDLTSPALGVRHYRGAYDAHVHPYAQVLIGQTGFLELEVDGHAHFVDAACGLVVPAGATHGYRAGAPARLIVLDSPPHRGLERCRRFLIPPRWRERVDGFDAGGILAALDAAARPLQRRPVRLDVIDAALEADLASRWTTARLATLFNLSAQRFHARFVELTGSTPMDHVRRRRLQAAQRRLKEGWPLETTALHVGYASASALAYALRRDCGVGARGLRQKN
jgi:AraC-like DNA-binding protein